MCSCTKGHLQNKTTAAIHKSKQAEIDKLAEILRNTDTGPQDSGQALKHFIKPNYTTSIQSLCKDDIVYTEEADKTILMNDFFVEQTILAERNAF